jgi:hypothetical protein
MDAEGHSGSSIHQRAVVKPSTVELGHVWSSVQMSSNKGSGSMTTLKRRKKHTGQKKPVSKRDGRDGSLVFAKVLS